MVTSTAEPITSVTACDIDGRIVWSCQPDSDRCLLPRSLAAQGVVTVTATTATDSASFKLITER